MEKKKFDFSGAFAFVLALLILAVFVPINMIFSYKDKVFDMTPSGQFTLSPVTKELLDETSDKQIDIYFLSNLLDLQEVPKYLPLYHTLTALEERDNISLTCFDPDKDVELAKSLDPTGILGVNPADIFVKCGDTTKKIDFIRCFPTDSNDILMYNGEELIAGAIKVCASGNLPTVYFLKGYNDKSLEQNYSSYSNEIRTDNYSVDELDLSTVDKVPDNTAIIYLSAPQKDLSDSDCEKLRNYISNGGAISMLLPPCETKGRFKNIESLLAMFELGMNYNKVTEKSAMLHPNVKLVSNMIPADITAEDDPRLTSILENYIKVSYPYPSEDMSEDLTTDINTKITDGTYFAYVNASRSFYTLVSDSAMIEKSSLIENLTLEQDSDKYTTVSTPMGGDSETAKEAEALSNEPLVMGYYSYNKQTGAKLILLGSDEMIDDNTLTIATYGTRMLTLFSNTWLYNSDIDMGIGAKSNSYDTLQFKDADAAAKTIRFFFIIPVVFALAGLAVWLKRRYA